MPALTHRVLPRRRRFAACGPRDIPVVSLPDTSGFVGLTRAFERADFSRAPRATRTVDGGGATRMCDSRPNPTKREEPRPLYLEAALRRPSDPTTGPCKRNR